MGVSRLNITIYGMTQYFRSMFKLRAGTRDYLYFEHNSGIAFASVAIYKTSRTCYRVMYYYSLMQREYRSEYISFRTIQDLCSYLDSKCESIAK